MRAYFSVITVTLNALQELQRTKESLVIQRCRDFEWIVVDGRSTDATVSWLRTTGRPDKWISESDHGIYDAMNKGVALASGEYLLFLNAGDELTDPDVLFDIRDTLHQESGHPDILFCSALLCLQNGRVVVRPARPSTYIRHGVPANHQATFYRARALPQPAYDVRYKICGDYFLAATMLIGRQRSRVVPRTVARFHVGGKSFQSPVTLIVEAWKIQKQVLRLGSLARIGSAIRRCIATAGIYVLGFASAPTATRQK